MTITPQEEAVLITLMEFKTHICEVFSWAYEQHGNIPMARAIDTIIKHRKG